MVSCCKFVGAGAGTTADNADAIPGDILEAGHLGVRLIDYKLRMKKNEAALKILEIQIPAGYSAGGQSVPAGTLMGALDAKLFTDNPWSPGQELAITGTLTATGRSNAWKLTVDYSTAVNACSAQASRPL